MVLLEAMYLGAPVVTSRNGGSMTLMGGSDQYGQMVEKFDVNNWAAAIHRYLNDSNYTRLVKENAQRLIGEQYTWDKIAKRMLDHLKTNGYEI